jgi:gamma-glutamyltranspeptidase / glutathione hydrolase
MSTTTGMSGGRPMIMSARGVVSSGHYLATQIGLDVLRDGGNAFDAAAATGFALTVVQPHQNGIGGEVPMVVYSAAERKVRAVSGHGIAPRAATLELFRKLGLRIVPGDGLLSAVVPSAFGSWILLLRTYGTMRLSRLLGPAVELARVGVPMYDALRDDIVATAGRMREEWPSSAEVFLPGGRPPKCGTIWRQPNWAKTFGRLAALDGKRRDRDAGLCAAYDAFYRGEIAERIVAFVRKNKFRDASGARHGGLLAMEDFGDFKPKFEEPASATYRGATVHKCGPWTQGPVLLQALNLLEGFDLAAMGHNSVRYIHTVTECMKLAFADREFYYGDPDFAAVPMDRLLSKEYAAERRRLVDPQRASLELRPGGRAPLRVESARELDAVFSSKAARGRGDTTKLEVIDAAGNMVSATPSGGWLHSSPVIPGLGFPLGNRGQMFSLAAGHPNCLAPGKRPRTTLTPSLATREGEPWMAFGSPGGDLQDQWALQFLLNVMEFGMSLQEAVEAPTFWTRHFPSSFYPRAAELGSLYVEGRISKRVRDALAKRGHDVKVAGGWDGGNTLAAEINPATGVRSAAASPRLEAAYAAGW